MIALVLPFSSCDLANDIPFFPKYKVEYKLSGSTNYTIQYTEENGDVVSTASIVNWSYSYKNQRGEYYSLHAENMDPLNQLTGEFFINGKSKGKQVTSNTNPYIDFSGTIE